MQCIASLIPLCCCLVSKVQGLCNRACTLHSKLDAYIIVINASQTFNKLDWDSIVFCDVDTQYNDHDRFFLSSSCAQFALCMIAMPHTIIVAPTHHNTDKHSPKKTTPMSACMDRQLLHVSIQKLQVEKNVDIYYTETKICCKVDDQSL